MENVSEIAQRAFLPSEECASLATDHAEVAEIFRLNAHNALMDFLIQMEYV
jgi:hypothetical protein